MNSLRSLFFAGVFTILAVPAQSPILYAQADLNLTRIVQRWPEIEIFFKAECNGQPEYPLDKQKFRIVEDGVEITNFALFCPDPTVRCAVSVSLVLDASGSMAGTPNQMAKDAGNLFVNQLDGIADQGCVLFFNSNVSVQQAMTANKTALHNAVDALPASGMAAVWDGVYAGLQEVIATGTNPCRAVIVLSNGQDNASTHTPEDIITMANQNRIRIFTIGLGSASATFQNLAYLTGGNYYAAPTPSQLVAIFEEISIMIFSGFGECSIVYNAACMDGGIRYVEVTWQNACDAPVTQSKAYRAPKDTSTFTTIDVSLGDASARAKQEATIPLYLETAVAGQLETAAFDVFFSTTQLQFKSFEAPEGSLLEGVAVTISPLSGGIHVQIMEKKWISGNGLLANLTFKTADMPDTTTALVQLANWIFDAGCFIPVLGNGEVTIYPRQPYINCTMDAPAELLWVRSIKDYNPNPFNVRCVVLNTGDIEAKNARFKIYYDPADFELRSPISDVQPGFPVDVLEGQTSEASWNMSAITRLSGDSVMIRIEISFDNHETISCAAKVWIQPTGPVLETSIDPVTIVADQDHQRYIPMPFSFNVHVLNRGGMMADSVYATIVVPPGDLQLAAHETIITKMVSPKRLMPGQTGFVTWQLTHPPTQASKEYTVQVRTKADNADEVLSEFKIVIPGLFAPRLQAKCSVPAELVFNDILDAYQPNPFTVTLEAANTGPMTAEGVTGFLYLPENVELVNPLQGLRAAFGDLTRWYPGDPIPSYSWIVRYTKRLTYDSELNFKFAVGGLGAVGQVPTDSAFTQCKVAIKAMPPAFAGGLTAPDTLRRNTGGYAVVPNPFIMRYSVWNKSGHAAKLESVEAILPNGEYGFDPSVPDNDAFRTVNQMIPPGDTAVFDWVVKVQNSIKPRTALLRAVASYEGGAPLESAATMQVQAITVSITCNLTLDNPVMVYDSASQSYTNPAVTATATLTNMTGVPNTNLQALIIVSDPGGFLQLDPSYPNANPWTSPVIFGGQQRTAEWRFTLAKNVDSLPPQFVDFSIAYGSDQIPMLSGACNATVQINPVIHAVPPKAPVYTGEVPLPDSTQKADGIGTPHRFLYPRTNPGAEPEPVYRFALSQNYPNPFSSSTDISYFIGNEADVSLTVHNILGRRVAVLAEGRMKAGQYTARFDAKGLPGGVYVVRFNAGTYSKSRVMLLQR